MAPGASLAWLRKWIWTGLACKEARVVQACCVAGISTSRFYELRARYLPYGELGLMPKPGPARDRRFGAPLAIRSSPMLSNTLGWRDNAKRWSFGLTPASSRRERIRRWGSSCRA